MRKRQRGEGTLIPIPTKKGYFYAEFPYHWTSPKGAKRTKSKRFLCKNITVGRAMFESWKEELENNKALEIAKANSVGQHIKDRWAFISANRRQTTRTTAEQLLDNHVYKDTVFCALDIDKITSKDVDAFLSRINGTNNMKRRVYKFVRSFFTYLVKDGTYTRNPITCSEIPKVESKKIEAFTEEEQTKLLNYVKDSPRWEALIMLSLETGCRQSEALGLKWDCVDFKEGKISIKRTLHANGQKTYIVEGGKSPAAIRTIRISAKTLTALQSLENALKNDSAFVFTDDAGQPWNRNALNKLWKRLLVRAGLKHGGWHQMRHSAITRLIKARVPLPTIAKYVGHSDVSLILSTYASVFESDMDAVPASFEGFVA